MMRFNDDSIFDRADNIVRRFLSEIGKQVFERRLVQSISEESFSDVLQAWRIPITADEITFLETGNASKRIEPGIRFLLAIAYLMEMPIDAFFPNYPLYNVADGTDIFDFDDSFNSFTEELGKRIWGVRLGTGLELTELVRAINQFGVVAAYRDVADLEASGQVVPQAKGGLRLLYGLAYRLDIRFDTSIASAFGYSFTAFYPSYQVDRAEEDQVAEFLEAMGDASKEETAFIFALEQKYAHHKNDFMADEDFNQLMKHLKNSPPSRGTERNLAHFAWLSSGLTTCRLTQTQKDATFSHVQSLFKQLTPLEHAFKYDLLSLLCALKEPRFTDEATLCLNDSSPAVQDIARRYLNSIK